MTDETVPRRSLSLLAGDWLALALFVLIGQVEHNLLDNDGIIVLLRGLAEFLLPWTAVALMMGALRRSPQQTTARFLAHSLNAWLVAAPIALLIRALLRGQAAIPVLFILVTLGLGGLFLLAWRGLYAAWQQRQTRPKNEPSTLR